MLSTKPNLFALVDCNNFFASCEQVFNPHLLNKPLVILSSNDGCIIARSKEAKALGLKMGEPYFKCRKEGVITLSCNFALYGDMSSRVMTVLEEFGYPVNVYSIDEAFIHLPKLSTGECEELCKAIKEKVKKWTGLPVAIGIASTKTLAKAANELAKKNGPAVLIEEKVIDEALSKLFAEDIWGIGRGSKATLKQKEIYTALELKNGPDAWIKKNLSVHGLKTVFELRGISCIDEDGSEFSKSMVSSRSFGKKLETFEDLKESVSYHAAHIGEKLRQQNAVCSHIGAFIYENEIAHHSSLTLPSPTSYTPLLIAYATKALKAIFKEGRLYKKSGVMVCDIVSNKHQLDLFHTRAPKQDALMSIYDNINQKWGAKSLFFASEGTSCAWKSKSFNKSPAYTTSWDELPLVKT